MEDKRTNRRLAAILAADVVGYSRLMASDESGTLEALKRHRECEFDPAVAAHGGRVVKLIGDGTLVEFTSVVDAVNCAVAIQKAVGAAITSDTEIVLRIGINLGDIIIDDDDIYGDGVNIAARLEPLAKPGGICVSSIVNESVGERTDVAFNDGGDVEVKNIERPIRVWHWHPGDATEAADDAPSAPVGLPVEDATEAPAIAVLPFENMSGDAEQEYFSDGISEDIITDLSKVSGLLVIARNSSFAYKGKSIDLRSVGRELGVTSLLEGSIRRAGNRVRITAQLIDAATGGHVWAERFDRDLTDIFEVQDEVTRRIVDALKVVLTPDEEERLATVATRSPEAHDCFLRGRELLMHTLRGRESFQAALRLFERAIELDPNYADAHGGLAMTYNYDYLNHWSDESDLASERSLASARRAVTLAPDEPYGHHALSLVVGVSGDMATAREAADTALRLNPNFAPAYGSRGVVEIYRAKPGAAIPYFEKAARLDPASNLYVHLLGMAHLLKHNYETAAATLRERIRMFPETDISRSLLAAALGHLGEFEEARSIWAELRAINPDYSVDEHMKMIFFHNAADAETVRQGLAKAGLIDAGSR